MIPWTPERGLVLVFEAGGFVYAVESPDDAAGSIESMDVAEGLYLGAFSDRGEILAMENSAQVYARFTPTGRFDLIALNALIRQSKGPKALADDPRAFASAVLNDPN